MRVVQRGLRFVILLLLLMMVVLITGCGGGGSGTTTNFKQGIGELQFRMLPNAPPDKIYQGSGFKIIVEASNHAAYDLKGVEVSIVGLNEKYFALTNKEQFSNPLLKISSCARTTSSTPCD